MNLSTSIVCVSVCLHDRYGLPNLILNLISDETATMSFFVSILSFNGFLFAHRTHFRIWFQITLSKLSDTGVSDNLNHHPFQFICISGKLNHYFPVTIPFWIQLLLLTMVMVSITATYIYLINSVLTMFFFYLRTMVIMSNEKGTQRKNFFLKHFFDTSFYCCIIWDEDWHHFK